MKLTINLHLVPRLRMTCYTFSLPVCLHGVYRCYSFTTCVWWWIVGIFLFSKCSAFMAWWLIKYTQFYRYGHHYYNAMNVSYLYTLLAEFLGEMLKTPVIIIFQILWLVYVICITWENTQKHRNHTRKTVVLYLF
jgi:hypothetical protein